MKRKIVAPGTSIEVLMSAAEKDLILEETFMDPECMERLVPVVGKAAQLVGKFTLDDIEDMLGDIAAASNHTNDRTLERKLDAIYERLLKVQRSYDDGNWNDSQASR